MKADVMYQILFEIIPEPVLDNEKVIKEIIALINNHGTITADELALIKYTLLEEDYTFEDVLALLRGVNVPKSYLIDLCQEMAKLAGAAGDGNTIGREFLDLLKS